MYGGVFKAMKKVLLLNASNMDTYPVYPYAFIQVPAIARRSGINVVCKDLLGIPQPSWERTLRALIEEQDPAMVLVTLRNTDSMVSGDYEQGKSRDGQSCAYFPIERTKELIAAIRAVSDLGVVLGGYGFSVMPDALMHYLRPDLGVFAGPDAFFAHFEDVQGGNFAAVANLLFFQDGQLVSNPRIFHPPFAGAEYTPGAIEDMMAFYRSFPSPGFAGAPVEVIRGCNHACVFCSEPLVKGAQVQYRDLSDVMADIGMLVDHGITQIDMISSELNPEGNDFVLQLAERVRAFNGRQAEARRIRWSETNYLLGFSSDEYERLYNSGFSGGWFDVTALDDENARAMRTPYRNERLLAHLKCHGEFETRRSELRRAQAVACADSAGEQDRAIGWTMFLGNPATTTRTIRNTLRTADREGVAKLFESCHLNANIRVFDYEEPDAALLAVAYSVAPDLARTGYQPLLPSFAYPPALLGDFGSEGEIVDLFKYLAETYLSTKYRETRDWHGFVRGRSTAGTLSRWLAELSGMTGIPAPGHLRQKAGLPATPALQDLFAGDPGPGEDGAHEHLAKQVVAFLLSACIEAFPGFFESLGLPSTAEALERTTPYKLAGFVLGRWATEEAFADELAERTRPVQPAWRRDLLRFCARAVLYMFNVRIRRDYRGLFL
jgi:hypothetical protein